MRSPRKQPIALFVAALVAILTSCSDVHDPLVQVTPTTKEAQHDVLVHPSREAGSGHARAVDASVGMSVDRLVLAVNVQRVREAAWVIATAKSEAERSQVAARPVVSTRRAATTGSLDSTIACIYAHESGNFSESSHPGSGSGAAQWIPSTWRAWSARAGYPGYDLAYQAPPSVQEAVLRYTLTHGGAGNWSPRFGNDPCTT